MPSFRKALRGDSMPPRPEPPKPPKSEREAAPRIQRLTVADDDEAYTKPVMFVQLAVGETFARDRGSVILRCKVSETGYTYAGPRSGDIRDMRWNRIVYVPQSRDHAEVALPVPGTDATPAVPAPQAPRAPRMPSADSIREALARAGQAVLEQQLGRTAQRMPTRVRHNHRTFGAIRFREVADGTIYKLDPHDSTTFRKLDAGTTVLNSSTTSGVTIVIFDREVVVWVDVTDHPQ